MKTPQQIKNEVEKEIEIISRVIELDMTKKCAKNTPIEIIKRYVKEDNENYNWEKKEIEIKEAQLSILTEYDKSIKEMIEELSSINSDCNHKGECIDTKELLSKIWDNSEVKEND